MTTAPETYLRLIASQGALIAEEGGQLRGYAILDLQTGEVDAIFVDPDHGGKGIGKQLLLGIEALALQHAFRRLYLFASLDAVAFYQAAGFISIRDEECPPQRHHLVQSVHGEGAARVGSYAWAVSEGTTSLSKRQ